MYQVLLASLVSLSINYNMAVNALKRKTVLPIILITRMQVNAHHAHRLAQVVPQLMKINVLAVNQTIISL